MRFPIATFVFGFFALFQVAYATFAQGAVNLTRDYLIEYKTKTYATEEAFCKAFRAKCVTIAGSEGDHHQLDCVYSQGTNPLYAFCGATPKNPEGLWVDGYDVKDNTRIAAAAVHGIIKGRPWGAKCKTYVKHHPHKGYVC